MKYITYSSNTSTNQGKVDGNPYKSDYNTNNYSESYLQDICDEWTLEDLDGTVYYLIDDEND